MTETILSWIEARRSLIGLVLIGLIAAGGIFLLWPTRIPKTNQATVSSNQPDDDRVAKLEATVSELTNRVNELSADLSASTNVKAKASTSDSGQVAGATSKKTVTTPTDKSKKVTSAEKSTSTVSGKININSASLSQLDTLTGIGATYAQRIIDYRTSHGGFKKLEELKEVKGIGDKTFDKIKDSITL
jgi:comEA protein